MDSCLTLGNELSEDKHTLTKKNDLIGKGCLGEGSRVRETRRTALPHGSQPQVVLFVCLFYCNGASFWFASGQLSC